MTFWQAGAEGVAGSSGAGEAQRGDDIPFQVAVHDGEEDLQEQVDGIYEHGKEVQPRFARHVGGVARTRRRLDERLRGEGGGWR